MTAVICMVMGGIQDGGFRLKSSSMCLGDLIGFKLLFFDWVVVYILCGVCNTRNAFFLSLDYWRLREGIPKWSQRLWRQVTVWAGAC